MEYFVETLLGLLNTFTDDSILNRRYIDPISSYRTTIFDNTEALNTLYHQYSPSISATARASLVCTASKLLFGQAVIEPKDPSYESFENENWFLIWEK
jgi:hypothetical protein